MSRDTALADRIRQRFEAIALRTTTDVDGLFPSPGDAVLLDLRMEDDDDALLAAAVARARSAKLWAVVSDLASNDLSTWLERISPRDIYRSGQMDALFVSLGRYVEPRFEFVSTAGDELICLLVCGSCLRVPLGLALGAARGPSPQVDRIELVDQGMTARIYLHQSIGAPIPLDVNRAVALHDPTGTAEHAGMSSSQVGYPITSEALAIDAEKLGRTLRELRKQAGLTQAEVAERSGIHRPNVARVENGRHVPSLETISRLAAAIGVPAARVLAGAT